MSEVNPQDFMVGQGHPNYGVCDPVPDSFVMPDDIKRSIGSGGTLGIPEGREPWLGAPTHINAYVVKSGFKECYTQTKEKAFQIASDMLDCDGKVEIKRIELN